VYESSRRQRYFHDLASNIENEVRCECIL